MYTIPAVSFHRKPGQSGSLSANLFILMSRLMLCYNRSYNSSLFTTISYQNAIQIFVPYRACNHPGSSVGTATELRAGQSGIESRWGRDFPPFQTGPGAHPASCKMGTGSFLEVKCDRGVLLTTHPLLVPRSWNSRAIPLPTLWATPGL